MAVLDWGKIVRHNQNLHHPIFVNHPVLDTLWKIQAHHAEVKASQQEGLPIGAWPYSRFPPVKRGFFRSTFARLEFWVPVKSLNTILIVIHDVYIKFYTFPHLKKSSVNEAHLMVKNACFWFLNVSTNTILPLTVQLAEVLLLLTTFR